MSEEQSQVEHDFWIRRLASRLVGELPTTHDDALQVLTYMGEFLTHVDRIAVPVKAETERSILTFDRKNKDD